MKGGGHKDTWYDANILIIMKQCPYCGSELPDDGNALYCLNCDHIIDENVFLRQKLKKELEKPKTTKGKSNNKKISKSPSGPAHKRNDNNYIPKMHYYEEKKSYGNIVLIVLVLIVIVYLLYH